MENISDYKYRRAKERVQCIKSFQIHLLVFVVIMMLLGFINFMTTSYPWVLWPALGWGLGLIGHWLHVFGADYILGSNWERRKIQELMDKDQ